MKTKKRFSSKQEKAMANMITELTVVSFRLVDEIEKTKIEGAPVSKEYEDFKACVDKMREWQKENFK